MRRRLLYLLGEDMAHPLQPKRLLIQRL
jgi:hypothetical protein